MKMRFVENDIIAREDIKKIKVPTKEKMKEYKKHLLKEAEKFRLTVEDLSNLYDLFYMVEDDSYETIKLNKMQKWFHKFHQRIERIVIPELYKNIKYTKEGKK